MTLGLHWFLMILISDLICWLLFET